VDPDGDLGVDPTADGAADGTGDGTDGTDGTADGGDTDGADPTADGADADDAAVHNPTDPGSSTGDQPAQQWGDGGPTQDAHGRDYLEREDGRRTLEGDPADTYRDRSGRLHDEDTHQFVPDTNRPDVGDLPVDRAVRGDSTEFDLDGDAQTAHDSRVDARTELQSDADAAASRVDQLVDEAGIDPADLTGRSSEIQQTLDSMVDDGDITQRQADRISDAMDSQQKALDALRGSSENLGDQAAGAVSAARGETTLVPPGGAGAGQLDHVSVTGDPTPTLHIYEAKGGGSSLGYRTVDGVRAEQGTTAYLNDIAGRDTRLQDSLDAYVQSPDADPRVVEAIRNGTLDVRYELVQARPDGSIRVTEFQIDRSQVRVAGSDTAGAPPYGGSGSGASSTPHAPALDSTPAADTVDAPAPTADADAPDSRAGDGDDPGVPADGAGNGPGPDRSSDQIIREYVDANGLSNQDLHDLRHTPAADLTPEQRRQLIEIRSLIEAPDGRTRLVKIIPFENIQKYLRPEFGGTGDFVRDVSAAPGVGGFVARATDLNPWGGLDQVVADARLDYTPADGQVNSYTAPGADSYGFIEFQTDDAGLLDVPYSPEFGGTSVHDQPFAGSGMLLNHDDVWRPEYEASGFMGVNEGARLWSVGPDGPRLVGIYIPGRGFIPVGSGS
jgi:hypothetical protein